MNYTKIVPKKRGMGKWYMLWMGEDHLLSVACSGYTESYSRYYFKDIQAVVSRRTSRGKILNAVFAVPAALFLLVGSGGSDGASITAELLGGTFLALLLWNVLRGPTCVCHLRTPLGVDPLPALGRVRGVKKVLAKLVPLIGQIQGEIAPEEITALVRSARDVPDPADWSTVTFTGEEGSAAQEAPPAYSGWLHRAAFLSLMAESALSLLQLVHNSKALVLFSTLVCLAFLLLAVAALIKQRSQPVTPVATWLTWGGVATMTTGSIVVYFFTIFLNLNRLKDMQRLRVDMLDMYATVQPAEHRALAFFILVYAVIAGVIGIVGMIALADERRLLRRTRP